jgi:hypothetical protein
MSIRLYKNLINIFLVFLFVWGCNTTFAAYSCKTYSDEMAKGETPSLSQLICPIAGLVNVAIGLVGGVFVIMVIYGSIKAYMALGDPKGLKGAHMTWFYAGIGLAVLLLSVSLLIIATSLFGITIGSPQDWFEALYKALYRLETIDTTTPP